MSQDQRQFNMRVQSLLNYLGADPKLLVDGAVGPKTNVAISKALAKYINVFIVFSVNEFFSGVSSNISYRVLQAVFQADPG